MTFSYYLSRIYYCCSTIIQDMLEAVKWKIGASVRIVGTLFLSLPKFFVSYLWLFLIGVSDLKFLTMLLNSIWLQMCKTYEFSMQNIQMVFVRKTFKIWILLNTSGSYCWFWSKLLLRMGIRQQSLTVGGTSIDSSSWSFNICSWNGLQAFNVPTSFQNLHGSL